MASDSHNIDLTPVPNVATGDDCWKDYDERPIDLTAIRALDQTPHNSNPTPIPPKGYENWEDVVKAPVVIVNPNANPVPVQTRFPIATTATNLGGHAGMTRKESKLFAKYLAHQEKEELELAQVLSLSQNQVVDPYAAYMDFMDALREKNQARAAALYRDADATSKQFIDSELDVIPWRISAECHQFNGKIQWINCWIKIGWWTESECEISPQLTKGKWVADLNEYPYGIETRYFDCAVWKGVGKAMIHRLLVAGPRVNVELAQSGSFLVPVDAAFTTAKDETHIFDLANVEIGSVDKQPNDQLDIMRMHHSVTERDDGTKVFLFHGCTMGSVFLPGGTTTAELAADLDLDQYGIESDDSEDFSEEAYDD